MSYATGVAAARPGRPLVLIDDDGGLLMHIQEPETIHRHGLKMLICVNDGAFGSEIHKLRADGLSDHGATFGRCNLANIAAGFGLRGRTITDLGGPSELLDAHRLSEQSEIWDFPISDQVMSPGMRKAIAKKKH